LGWWDKKVEEEVQDITPDVIKLLLQKKQAEIATIPFLRSR
jgi:hypothetical protein